MKHLGNSVYLWEYIFHSRALLMCMQKCTAVHPLNFLAVQNARVSFACSEMQPCHSGVYFMLEIC